MRKLRVQDLLCMFSVAAYTCSLSCSCMGKKNNFGIHGDDEDEYGALMPTNHNKSSAPLKLKDLIAPTPTLAFQLKPKVLRLIVF
ncbi:Heavy metal transport/detoxification superfamily protein [Salvia divinorum]|uniref:Heavy metal transport/detoxification superfamily protein n=1 Tax=Salvia divinorum TaxID=28513 RepID=A0ABD1H653_SALDI